MAEYCDTPQSKERRNRKHKVCLNERAILRLLDHEFSKNSDVLLLEKMGSFRGCPLTVLKLLLAAALPPLLSLLWFATGFVEFDQVVQRLQRVGVVVTELVPSGL